MLDQGHESGNEDHDDKRDYENEKANQSEHDDVCAYAYAERPEKQREQKTDHSAEENKAADHDDPNAPKGSEIVRRSVSVKHYQQRQKEGSI
jgi:hypothetical protein